MDVFAKTNSIYFSTLNLVVGFSIFILFALLLLPIVSSYVNVGGGFIRFSSLYLDLTAIEALLFFLVGVISILSLSAFITALVSIVKLKETMDHFGYKKVVITFRRHVKGVFLFMIGWTVASIIIGVILGVSQVPFWISQAFIFLIWLPVIFVPQIMVLEDYGIVRAVRDSAHFIKKQPKGLMLYLATGAFLVFLATVVEWIFGNVFVWEHRIIGLLLVSLFVVPYLQMLATVIYVQRYHLGRTRHHRR
jgi:uncharacterized membrane protein YhdT